MIKVYCDKCGKEITGNVNMVSEETKATDLYGNVVAKWKDMFHYCDECQYEDLTCGFKVGDQVITDNGRIGVIVDICDCESCKRRGFYEPRVKMEIGEGQIYITDTDKKNGFISFYKIGDQVFGNLDEKWLLDVIKGKKEEIRNMQNNLVELEAQLNVVRMLKRRKEQEKNWSDLTD
jgi:hypothetical protein